MSTVVYKQSHNVKLISWGAIVAGSVLALTIYLLCGVLGSAIGASVVQPHEADPLAGFSYAAGAWVVITTVVALIIGGYYSGRSAHALGWLHGVLTWSVVTLLTTYLLTAATSSIISTTASVFGKGIAVAGAGMAKAAPAVADKVKTELQQNGINLDTDHLRREFDTLLLQSGKPELAPQNISQKAQNASDDAKATASHATQQPQAADTDFASWLERVRQSAQPALNAADKDALVNIIQARTGKSHDEAQAIADRYEQIYNQAMINYQNLKQQAEQKARDAADKAARNLARASWWTFAALVVGALVAAAAGNLGFRHQTEDNDNEDVLAVSNR